MTTDTVAVDITQRDEATRAATTITITVLIIAIAVATEASTMETETVAVDPTATFMVTPQTIMAETIGVVARKGAETAATWTMPREQEPGMTRRAKITATSN